MNVSEKHIASIFMDEVAMLASGESLHGVTTQKNYIVMKTVCFSETLVSISKFTRRSHPEDHHRHLVRRDNLKSRILTGSSVLSLGLCRQLLG
jgi:hypothetical protein